VNVAQGIDEKLNMGFPVDLEVQQWIPVLCGKRHRNQKLLEQSQQLDVAAGPDRREAGGKVTDFKEGRDFVFWQTELIATNGLDPPKNCTEIGKANLS